MKKTLLFLAAALLVAVSCNTKEDKTDNKDTSLQTPSLEQYAFKTDIKDKPNIPLPTSGKPDGSKWNEGSESQIDPNAKNGNLKGIETMNDGTWNADIEAKDANGDPGDYKFSGSFEIQGQKVSVGDIYNMTGWGTLAVTKLNGSEIGFSFTPVAGGDPIMLNGTLASAISGDASLLKDLSRTWKVEKTLITVTSETLTAGIGGEYTGCDIPAIANDLKNKGLNIDADKANYKVSKVALSKYGTVKIYLDNGEILKGSIQDGKLNGNDFNYKFDIYDNNNPILSVEGKGSVKVVKGKLNLSLSGSLKDKAGKAYNAEVKFILVYE